MGREGICTFTGLTAVLQTVELTLAQPTQKHIVYLSNRGYKRYMFLYIIGTDGNRQKIGFSRDVGRRLATLQTGNPEKLKIHHFEPVPEKRVRMLERKLHRELGYKRLKGEWFDMGPTEAVQMLQFAIIRWLDDPLL